MEIEKYVLIQDELIKQLIEKVDMLYNAINIKTIQNNKEEWLQPEKAMRLLGLLSRTMQNLRNEGKIGFSQLSRKKILYRRADIEKMLEGKYVQPFKTGSKNGK